MNLEGGGEGWEGRHSSQNPWMNEEIVKTGAEKKTPSVFWFSLILKKNRACGLQGGTHLGRVKWFTAGKVEGGQGSANTCSFA